MIKVKIKLLHPDAVIPARATPGSMGYDVKATYIGYSVKNIFDKADGVVFPGKVLYGLGFAMEIPVGESCLLLPRSSIIAKNMILANSIGLIDSDYRKEVLACFYYAQESLIYKPGERVGQFVFYPDPDVEFVQVKRLSKTKRVGGFGSTGK